MTTSVTLQLAVQGLAMQGLAHRAQLLAMALLPPICGLCRQGHTQPTAICRDCIDALQRNTHACGGCAEPAQYLDSQGRCYRCQTKSPLFASVTAPFLMTGYMQQLIHQWKFEGHTTLSPMLAALLIKHLVHQQKVEADTGRIDALMGLAKDAIPVKCALRSERISSIGPNDDTDAGSHTFPSASSAGKKTPAVIGNTHNKTCHSMPQFLIPIPSHWRRRWHRGFDQTWLLANNLTRLCGIPTLRGLRRTRFASAQHQLSRRERAANMHDAFTARCQLSGGHIALVDDVVTTGATATAATQVLLAAGADSVEVWCLARTPAPVRNPDIS